jgi:formylglycine-generating enzyme required for sulfatase activity
VQAGSFVKGSAPNEPYRGAYTEDQRTVTLTHAFVMGQHEVTQGEWEAAGYKNLAGTKSDGQGGTDCVADNCPASTMTFFEAVQYANALSDKSSFPHCLELDGCTGTVGIDFRCSGYHQTTPSYYDCAGYRLPTSIEFEYAIRAGTTTVFYSGIFQPLPPAASDCIDIPHLDPTAWYCTNAGERTHPVQQKTPNPWGLYDMMGNAAEYVASDPDIIDQGFTPETDPLATIPDGGTFGAAGGPFFAWPLLMRSPQLPYTFYVLSSGTDQRTQLAAGYGFRLVRSLKPDEAAAW